MNSSSTPKSFSPALLQPLRKRSYLLMWMASVLSNLGQLVQGVGSAWEMTRLTNDPKMVALVQTATFLPLMLLSLPAGAMADMFDRRKVALSGLSFALLAASLLTALALLDWLGAWSLLTFCLLIGSGVAIFSPAWQSSVAEQVEPEHLPAAVALSSVSYNVARSIGPAVGGVLVAVVGSAAAFGANAVFYVPMMAAFFLWKRRRIPSRLPPERIDRAIVAGVRYTIHSPPIRTAVFRTLMSSLASAAVMALAPMVAKDLLGGSAGVYGMLLGTYGAGSICGATLIARARSWGSTEAVVRWTAILAGSSIFVIGVSRSLLLTLAAFFLTGLLWMLQNSTLNVSAQLAAPRWVMARVLGCWSTAVTAGLSLGAWSWGQTASVVGTSEVYVLSGSAVGLTALIGFWLPMQDSATSRPVMPELRENPQPQLPITMRSGPIVIEIDYRIDPHVAREFYLAMQDIRRARLRSGAFDWSLARDLADPESWTERFYCPTWGDYLLQRNRTTQAELEAEAIVQSYHRAGPGPRVRRWLERPFGSVRKSPDSPDNDRISIYPP